MHHHHFVSIFPDIFSSWLSTSLIAKAQERDLLAFSTHDPRQMCTDRHQQVDDQIYGGGQGMLIKAQPIIDTLKKIITDYDLRPDADDRRIIMVKPSPNVFHQTIAEQARDRSQTIWVCGRYEGIDHRVMQWLDRDYPTHRSQWSLGSFITLGGEVCAMTMAESIVRLIPGVIKEEDSRTDESYRPEHNCRNLEYPQYTRPDEVEGFAVPEILLSGHHARIEEWKQEQMRFVDAT